MSASRPGIVKRTCASEGVCSICESARLVTHYDRTTPGYICADCAPQAILVDLLLLVAMKCKHPNPHSTPNH